MNSEIIQMILSGLFSLAGAGMGVMTTSRLTNYRLEKKVDILSTEVKNYSSLGQRIALLEQRMNIFEKEKP